LLKSTTYRGFPIIDAPHTAILLGYISRTELAFALSTSLSQPHSLTPETETYFSHQPMIDPTATLDLRPWMDQTPITLNAKASLQLTVNMFQRLGLRYVVFVEKGALRGLLTKKDVWKCLNKEKSGGREDDMMGMGGREDLRDEGREDGQGLLDGEGSEDGERDERRGLG
jgi:chloride channel 3/4/5